MALLFYHSYNAYFHTLRTKKLHISTMKTKVKKIIWPIIMVVGISIQFIHFDINMPNVSAQDDLLVVNDTPERVKHLLKVACYDCHSNETRFPWYNNIVPVQWWLANHINEAKRHLNFSAWGTYSQKRVNHKIKECIELIDAEEMPLTSYTITHADARLTIEDRMLLTEWFRSIRQNRSIPSQNQ